MNGIKSLHQSAAEFSVFGDVAKAKGNAEEARFFYRKAFELERDAAENISPGEKDPLSRHILLLSSAALAYYAHLFDEAEKYVALALSENPPAYFVFRLNELADLVNQARAAAPSKNGKLQIEGKLTSATESEITVVEKESRNPYAILVPAGKLKEIVRNFFLETVAVQATASEKGAFLLKKISKAA